MKKQLGFAGIIMLCAILISNAVSAQNKDTVNTNRKNILLAVSPFYLINKALKVDIEKKLPYQRQWIQVSPQFYFNSNGESYDFFDDAGYDEMIGFGIDVHHKIYMQDRELPSGVYAAYGLVYHHIALKFDGYVWENVEIDGKTYLQEAPKKAKQKNNKLGANLIFGIQPEMNSSRFILDFYAGIGFRYTLINTNVAFEKDFNDFYWDYGYTGTCLVAGFKLGVIL